MQRMRAARECAWLDLSFENPDESWFCGRRNFGDLVRLKATPQAACRAPLDNTQPSEHDCGNDRQQPRQGKRMSYREVSEIRDGMRIDWDMPIEMDDGTVLRCDIYRPIKAGRYPVLLTLGPYGKWLHFDDLYSEQWKRMCEIRPDVPNGSTNKYQCWEVVDPEKWVPDGYVCIRVDSRGAGRSPGVIDIWSLQEALDLKQCVEWAGVQPWSNGKVGLNGISYYAENQWQCAALQPKHLAAICLWEGAADFYRDMAHHGGIFCNGFTKGWSENQVYTLQHGRGTRGFRSRMTGDWVSGPLELTDEELGANRRNFYEDCLSRKLDTDDYWQSASSRRCRASATGNPRGARRQSPQLLRGLPVAEARHRRLLADAHAGLVEGESAAAVGRQLGRPGPASARQ